MGQPLGHCQWRLQRQAPVGERVPRGRTGGRQLQISLHPTFPPRRQCSGNLMVWGAQAFFHLGVEWRREHLTSTLGIVYNMPSHLMKEATEVAGVVELLKEGKRWCQILLQVCLAGERWPAFSELLEMPLWLLGAELPHVLRRVQVWQLNARTGQGSPYLKYILLFFKKDHLSTMELNVSIVLVAVSEYFLLIQS